MVIKTETQQQNVNEKESEWNTRTMNRAFL
jgi:hypothetical protein